MHHQYLKHNGEITKHSGWILSSIRGIYGQILKVGSLAKEKQ